MKIKVQGQRQIRKSLREIEASMRTRIAKVLDGEVAKMTGRKRPKVRR